MGRLPLRIDGQGDKSLAILLTPSQAESLVTLLSRSHPGDDGLDALARDLQAAGFGAAAPTNDASVLAEAASIVAGAQIDVTAEDEALNVADAVATVERRVVAAALTTAHAASAAREQKAHNAAGAAQEVARTAAETAAEISRRATALAARVAAAAVEAAAAVTAANPLGDQARVRLTALRLAATVDALAATTADETASAASAVATAVTAAAVHAALHAASDAADFEREVAIAAAALEVIAVATARGLAVDTDARAVQAALAARRDRS